MEAIQSPQTNLSWPDVYLTAESNNEPFQDIRIVTAKSELLIQARSAAVSHLLKQQKELTDDAVDQIAEKLVQTNQIQVFESVSISNDKPLVCIDVDILDDESTWKALDLIYLAICNEGEWKSSTPISYNWSELV